MKLYWAFLLAVLIGTSASAQTYPRATVNGTGRQPAPPPALLSWNPPLISMAADSGSVIQMSTTLLNSGGSPITGRVALDAACSPFFSIVAGGGVYTLGPGQPLTVTVRFAPRAIGSWTCLLNSGP